MNIAVRYATLADSERIARLVTMLGYPVSPSQMRTRLEEIVADDDYVTLVACDHNEVVGSSGHVWVRFSRAMASTVRLWRWRSRTTASGAEPGVR